MGQQIRERSGESMAASGQGGRRKASRGRTPSGKANPIDVHVGGRIRLRRSLLGMTQEKLGEALGLTFQQVQKYERGANRVGMSRLFDLCQILNVPPGYFFDDMPEEIKSLSPAALLRGQAPGLADAYDSGALAAGCDNPMAQRETIELVRNFHRIGNTSQRKAAYELVRSMAESAAAA